MGDSDASARATQTVARTTARLPWAVIWFSAFYTFVATLYGFLIGSREVVQYIVVILVLATTMAMVHQRVSLTRGLLWCFSLWGLFHLVGGLVPVPESWQTRGPIRVIYSLWLIPGYLKYDQLIHFYGFGITTWLCWQALRAALAAYVSPDQNHQNSSADHTDPKPTLGLMVLCAAGGMGFGAFNEVVEFFATLTMPNTNVGGYENTGWDLVFNFMGCAFAACLIGWKGKARAPSVARSVHDSECA